MIIKIEQGFEDLEQFNRIVDQIIRNVVELRGMPLEKGRYMRTSIEQIRRNDTDATIIINVNKVECSRLEDF